MSIENMKVGELIGLVDALRNRAQPAASSSRPTIDHGMAIVILDRGFVYVGCATTEDDWCVIQDARNIRYWGTTMGLGQLVREGPTSSTKLDPVGTVKAPLRAVIAVLPTKEELWNKS